jgi:hypothetical protein
MLTTRVCNPLLPTEQDVIISLLFFSQHDAHHRCRAPRIVTGFGFNGDEQFTGSRYCWLHHNEHYLPIISSPTLSLIMTDENLLAPFREYLAEHLPSHLNVLKFHTTCNEFQQMRGRHNTTVHKFGLLTSDVCWM